ncbi:MAG: PEGA domain-containing protein [Acidobacteria bacterium]|nr:PEGA domain-containing protein [Acidobacteriota bacterium]
MATAGCATMANGTTQRIRVTSEPPGASVFLDGRPVGTTPTQVTASRRNREPLIRIEKGGFQTAAYRLERREDLSTVLWDVALGAAIIATTGRLMLEHDDANPTFGQIIVAFGAGATLGIVDYANGAAFRFPPRIDAILEPELQLRRPDQFLENLNRALGDAR